MMPPDKPIVWLHSEVKTPPFSSEARKEAGMLLRRLQKGETLRLPESRPMAVIGQRVHELRIADLRLRVQWRIVYRTQDDAVVILGVFEKKTRATPIHVIATCRRRLALFERA